MFAGLRFAAHTYVQHNGINELRNIGLPLTTRIALSIIDVKKTFQKKLKNVKKRKNVTKIKKKRL